MPCDEGLSPHEIHNWVKSDKKLHLTCCNFVRFLFKIGVEKTAGGPRLVRFLGPGKNRTMRNSY